jgi:hypothetical protein
LLGRLLPGAAPSPLAVAYLRHAVAVGLIPLAVLLSALASPLHLLRLGGGGDHEPGATLLALVADALPTIAPPDVAWAAFLADSTAPSSAPAPVWDPRGAPAAVLTATRLAVHVLGEGAGADEAAPCAATTAAVRVLATVAGQLRLRTLLAVAVEEDRAGAQPLERLPALLARLPSSTLLVDVARTLTTVVFGVAMAMEAAEDDDEQGRGGPLPSPAVHWLLLRLTERALVHKEDAGLDLLRALRHAHVRPTYVDRENGFAYLLNQTESEGDTRTHTHTHSDA